MHKKISLRTYTDDKEFAEQLKHTGYSSSTTILGVCRIVHSREHVQYFQSYDVERAVEHAVSRTCSNCMFYIIFSPLFIATFSLRLVLYAAIHFIIFGG